ncbi:MAG: serine hydrolase domain-containing protein, partial [Maribacter sp.]
MIPILAYLRNIFSSKRIIGDNEKLHGLIKIDALLKHLVDDNKIPGLSITVLKSGLPIFEKGYGYADLELKIAINPRTTIFRIASVSKPIAATALAHMVNEG